MSGNSKSVAKGDSDYVSVKLDSDSEEHDDVVDKKKTSTKKKEKLEDEDETKDSDEDEVVPGTAAMRLLHQYESEANIKPLKKQTSLVYSRTSKKYRRVDSEVHEFDDDELDNTEIVKASDSLEDTGVKFVRTHGGDNPEGIEAFRGSLRDGDNAYDLIMSANQIRMTWASRKSNGKDWEIAHSKSIFPEHVSELDYHRYTVQVNLGGWIARSCYFRCPRIGFKVKCCKIRCCRYERGTFSKRKLVKPAVVQPCVCVCPKISICSGLNPVTAFIHLGLLVWCFVLWFTSMVEGKKTGLIKMLPSIKPMGYASLYLIFLLICELITIRNYMAVEKRTKESAEEDEETDKTPLVKDVDPNGEKDVDSNGEEDKTGKEEENNDETKIDEKKAEAEKKEKDKKKEKKKKEDEDTDLEEELDDGIEPGGVKMTKKERMKKSIAAIHEMVQSHKRAFYVTSCVCVWHVLCVLILGVATLGTPYTWDGLHPVEGFFRQLSHTAEKDFVNYCVEPNKPQQTNAEFWCDATYYNMLYQNEPQGEPYWKCPPVVDCEVSEWGQCTKTCGNGTQTRTIITPASGGGKECTTVLQQYCNTAPCDCKLSDWGTCSKECAGGFKEKSIVQLPTEGGKACPAQNSTLRQISCNPQSCSAEDCIVSDYSKCSKTCGGGTQTREVLRNPLFGGKACPTKLNKNCNTQACPKVDCVLEGWTKCSKTCGNGTQTRIMIQPSGGGKACPSPTPTQFCNTAACGETPEKKPPVKEEKDPELPPWYCPVDSDPEPLDPNGHLHRAEQQCGHCHSRFMGPWVAVMIALCIEFIVTIILVVITYERRRLGRFVKGKLEIRRKKKAVYEREPGKKGTFTKGSFSRPSIKRSRYEPSQYIPSQFRYIKPKIMSLGKLVITDRAKRQHVLYLTKDQVMEAHIMFFKIQNQTTRKAWVSHSSHSHMR
eukprot:g6839.t1